MHQMQRDAGESDKAFMAKVVAGLAQAKAQSDIYLTPFVDSRKQQNNNNNSAGVAKVNGNGAAPM